MKTLHVNEDDYNALQMSLASSHLKLQQDTSEAIARFERSLGENKPKPMHPDDVAVSLFTIAMKDKMRISREKGRAGWNDKVHVSGEDLADMLVEHLLKDNHGNFVDIANFCMMLHQRGDDPKVIGNALRELINS